MSSDLEIQYIKVTIQAISPTTEAILKGRAAEFTNETYEPFDGLIGGDVTNFVTNYAGGNGFLNNLKSWVKRGRGLTLSQKRAAADMIRKAVRDEDLSQSHGFANKGGPVVTNSHPAFQPPSTPPVQAPEPDINLLRGLVVDDRSAADKAIQGSSLRAWQCYTCNKFVVGTMEDLYNHKQSIHGAANSNYGANSRNQRTSAARVRTEPKFNIDLRATFPDNCRFAIRQADGSCNFYILKTHKTRQKLTGRFQWSKFATSWGSLYQGDVSLRKRAGDTREFVGMQATDDSVYFGEYEEDVAEAAKDPRAAMDLYAKEINECCYCGKTLTDYESRQLGIGPDCLVEKHIPYLQRLRAQQAVV